MIDMLLDSKFRIAILIFEISLLVVCLAADWGFGLYIGISLCANSVISLTLSIIQTNKTIEYNIKNNALGVAYKLLNEENASKIRVRNYNR